MLPLILKKVTLRLAGRPVRRHRLRRHDRPEGRDPHPATRCLRRSTRQQKDRPPQQDAAGQGRGGVHAASNPQRRCQRDRQAPSESGIIVEGLDNCLVKFAKCCTPVPGRPGCGLHHPGLRRVRPPGRTAPTASAGAPRQGEGRAGSASPGRRTPSGRLPRPVWTSRPRIGSSLFLDVAAALSAAQVRAATACSAKGTPATGCAVSHRPAAGTAPSDEINACHAQAQRASNGVIDASTRVKLEVRTCELLVTRVRVCQRHDRRRSQRQNRRRASWCCWASGPEDSEQDAVTSWPTRSAAAGSLRTKTAR